jgi:hypothetical protein
MNALQVDVCCKILNSLLRRPISSFFWTPSPVDLSVARRPPISFKWISERLERGLYLSADEWVSDMRTIFTVSHGHAKSALRSAAAAQLEHEFSLLLRTLTPALSPHTLLLQRAEARLFDLVVNFRPSLLSPAADGRHPAAEIFAMDQSRELPKLAEDIRNLFTPTLLLRVAAFVSVIEPPALIITDEYFRILLSQMSEGNQIKLREFVTDLMRAAACGELEVFADRKPALRTQVL